MGTQTPPPLWSWAQNIPLPHWLSPVHGLPLQKATWAPLWHVAATQLWEAHSVLAWQDCPTPLLLPLGWVGGWVGGFKPPPGGVNPPPPA